MLPSKAIAASHKNETFPINHKTFKKVCIGAIIGFLTITTIFVCDYDSVLFTSKQNNLHQRSISQASIITDDNLHEWMKLLPTMKKDKKLITMFNIPGTHDSMSFYPLKSNDQFTVCTDPSYTILEQLRMGIRFLDIRLQHISPLQAVQNAIGWEKGTKPTNVTEADIRELLQLRDIPISDEMVQKQLISEPKLLLFHGLVYQFADYDDLHNQLRQFLQENKYETVILKIKNEATFKKIKDERSEQTFADVFVSKLNEFLMKGKNEMIYYRGTDPTINNCAGKVLILPDGDWQNEPIWHISDYNTNFGEDYQAKSDQYGHKYNGHDPDKDIQDRWKMFEDGLWKVMQSDYKQGFNELDFYHHGLNANSMIEGLKSQTSILPVRLYTNFFGTINDVFTHGILSKITDGTPLQWADAMNPKLLDWLKKNQQQIRETDFGVITFDIPSKEGNRDLVNKEIIRLIVESNFGDSIGRERQKPITIGPSADE